MKVYIAGPMTNQPRFNRPAFFVAADRLKALSTMQYFLMAFLLLITCRFACPCFSLLMLSTCSMAGKAVTVQLRNITLLSS